MPRHDVEDDDLDPEAPDESDWDSGDVGTIVCPHCGREIYEAAQQCPKCGKYLSKEDAPRPTPWWILIAAALALLAAMTWLLR
jgi:predicted nucleic acid-binding Zn ribbon protein